MVTFHTVGDPLIHIEGVADKKVKFSVTELLDPQHPYIDIMRGSYEYEDDADIETLAHLQILETKGREDQLLKYASVMVEVAPRTNRPRSPAAGRLLMSYTDILAKGNASVTAWRPYQLRVLLQKYLIKYHNSMFNETGTIQLTEGNLLVQDGDRCLTLHRYAMPGTKARRVQLDFTNSDDGCTSIILSEDNNGAIVCRYYDGVPYDEHQILARATGPRYGYRRFPI